MKVHNAVVGMEVQVKRDSLGHADEIIKRGLVCTVGQIDNADDRYELLLEHPDIDCGFAWVNASDVRRYIKPTESPEPIVKLTKGTKVRVKSTVVGEWSERLQEGDIYILNKDEDIACDGTSRRLDVSPVGGGSSWSTQPKYFDVLPDEVPEEPQDDIQVGDSVLVGAEGAGYGFVDKAYAGLTCTVHPRKHSQSNIVYIQHPDVRDSRPYATHKRYLTKVDPKPVRPDLSTLRVGDYIVVNDTDPHLQEGVAYRVVRVHAQDVKIALHHSNRAIWRAGYWIEPEHVTKILREVNDATPRVVKSGSESTSRSE